MGAGGTVGSVSERIDYDEFGLFHENAAEHGLPYDGPPVVHRTSVEVAPGRAVSALVWGTSPPELVLVHGGAQNAHTWDTVAMALGRPLVAIDLPGHGHSDAAGPAGISPRANAADLAAVVRELAPRARVVVGMSLGGLSAIALAEIAPELVRSLALVDITPGVTGEKAKAITAFVDGPQSFPSFDELLARTVEHNPTRTVSSLRRGILHNALQLDDGSWVWRYRRFAAPSPLAADGDRPLEASELWDVIGRLDVPVLLVRGMLPQSVVDDGDEGELLRRLPSARVARVAGAGHSVQGDQPIVLAGLLEELLG